MSVSLYPLRHVRHFGTSDKTQRLSSTTRIIRRGHGFLQRCDELWLRKYREDRANALKALPQHHLQQVLGIQSTGEALAGHALLAALLPLEVARDVAHHGKVLGDV